MSTHTTEPAQIVLDMIIIVPEEITIHIQVEVEPLIGEDSRYFNSFH